MKGVANAKRYETQVPTIIASRTFSSLANRYLLVISGSQNKKVTVEEAIEAYTLTSAYASFEDHIKGSIVPGKRADMIVLSEDLLTVPTNEIRNVEVLYTIVGGKVVYSKK